MNSKSYSKSKKLKVFIILSFIFIIIGVLISYQLYKNTKLNILPILLEAKDHPKPKRTPGTFAENFGKKASKAELIYNDDNSFSFKYTKTEDLEHAFAGVWFPTENLNIRFEEYDEIEIEIFTINARRIAFNLSVQNNLESHQYIQNLIEIEKGKTTYNFLLDDFITPTEWYTRNKVSQIDIPKPDLSKIEALSFESCHLLERGVEDEFTISKITLIKDRTWLYSLIIGFELVLILGLRVLLFGFWGQTEKVIRILISPLELKDEEKTTDEILIYLANNYTNPNLTLTELSKEFGITTNDISTFIKEKTDLSFPQYLDLLRIEEAKRIFKSGKFSSISEVGYMVGFNSPSNFNAVFKNIEGHSPTLYTGS